MQGRPHCSRSTYHSVAARIMRDSSSNLFHWFVKYAQIGGSTFAAVPQGIRVPRADGVLSDRCIKSAKFSS
jgi:hypothetical protein